MKINYDNLRGPVHAQTGCVILIAVGFRDVVRQNRKPTKTEYVGGTRHIAIRTDNYKVPSWALHAKWIINFSQINSGERDRDTTCRVVYT